jgi:hypothetical protein
MPVQQSLGHVNSIFYILAIQISDVLLGSFITIETVQQWLWSSYSIDSKAVITSCTSLHQMTVFVTKYEHKQISAILQFPSSVNHYKGTQITHACTSVFCSQFSLLFKLTQFIYLHNKCMHAHKHTHTHTHTHTHLLDGCLVSVQSHRYAIQESSLVAEVSTYVHKIPLNPRT